MADLDAIEAALAGWRGVFAARPAEEYDNGGPMVANVVRLGPRLAYLPDDGDEDDAEAWTDIGDMDPHCHPSLAVLLNAPGPLAAEIRTLRTDLAAARLDAANARSAAVEALALLDARLNTRTLEGYVFKDEAEAQAATLRARLDASDFAARATAAIDKYGEAERDLGYDARDAVPDDGNAPFPVDADKQQARDAARAEVLAVIGVGRG